MKHLLDHALVGKIKTYIIAHKIISGVVAILVIWGGYSIIGKLTSTAGEIKYVTTHARKDTLVVSVSGSGQVTATNQIDVKSKVSGAITKISVINGQDVKTGAPLLQIDSRDALKQVRDAEVNLQSAQLSLEKLTKPADVLTLTQAENALEQAKQNKINAESDLQKAYDDGFNNVSTTFLDLPSIMTGLNSIFYSYDLDRTTYNIDKYGDMAGGNPKTSSYKQDFVTAYQIAKTSYDTTIDEYKQTSRSDSRDKIEKLITDTYNTTKSIAEAIKAGNNFLDLVKGTLDTANLTKPTILATHQTSLSSYTSRTSSDLLSLLSIKDSIRNSQDSILNGERSITEKTAALENTKNGADVLDIKSSELSVLQRKNALQDARENLSNYYITAPLDSTVAKVAVNRLDNVSSGTTLITLITNKNTAAITLNEIDIAKIKLGQKATLTFDAVDGLTISGTVIDMDTIGTVSQGVVSYGVKIGFDTNESSIKPGMSVSAAIITDVKTDALVVPNSAVTTSNGGSFVKMFATPITDSTSTQGIASSVAPNSVPVTIGLSNDTDTEILSGINEGDQVVSRIINPTTTTTTSAPSLFGSGARGVTGGAVRATGR